MAPEQLLFFAIFLLLALFNLFARWLRSRMGQPRGAPGEPEAPRRGDRGSDIRENPPPREMPPARQTPSPRRAPPLREAPRSREAPPSREPYRRPEPPPGPLPPRARVRAPVSLEETAARAPVSLEETGARSVPPLHPSSPATVQRRRARLRLGGRADLRRAILLRDILGPPRAGERPERDV